MNGNNITQLLTNNKVEDIDFAKKLIICLAGRKRCGKTTTANMLLKSFDAAGVPATIVSFGYAVKCEVSQTYDIPMEMLTDQKHKDDEVIFYMKSSKDPRIPADAEQLDVGTYKSTVRKLMQWYATDYRRKQDPEYWIKKTFEDIVTACSGFDVVVIDDGRFPNELELIGYFENHHIVKLLPHEHYEYDDTAYHYSETALDDIEVPNTISPRYGEFYLKLLANSIYQSDIVESFLRKSLK